MVARGCGVNRRLRLQRRSRPGAPRLGRVRPAHCPRALQFSLGASPFSKQFTSKQIGLTGGPRAAAERKSAGGVDCASTIAAESPLGLSCFRRERP
jgi:hypothetical protein